MTSIHLIITKDSFQREAAAKRFLTKHASEAAAPVILHGGQIVAEDFSVHLCSGDLFGTRPLVWLKEVEALKGPLQDTLAALFPVEALLVLTASSLRANSKLYKAIQKQGTIEAIAEEKPWEKEARLASWLIQEAKQEGKNMPQDVARELVSQMSTDRQLLHQELEKLICYVGEKKMVTHADVAAISSREKSYQGWDLSDASLSGHFQEALQIGHSLLSEGTHLVALLALLRRQLVQLWRIGELQAGGGGAAQVTELYPQLRGRRAEQLIALAKRIGAHRMRNFLLLLRDAEVAAKDSRGEPTTILTRLVGRMAS